MKIQTLIEENGVLKIVNASEYERNKSKYKYVGIVKNDQRLSPKQIDFLVKVIENNKHLLADKSSNEVVKVFKESVLLDIRIKQNLTMKNFK